MTWNEAEPEDGGDQEPWGKPDPGPWGEPGPEPWAEADSSGWPLHPGDLYPRERWLWFEQLWADVCALRERYRLPLRSAWWRDEIQVEALAALAAWTQRYDTGEWSDPPGKLALLYDLERIGVLLRDGNQPFHPERDRLAFDQYLFDLGCDPPPAQAPDGA